MSASYHVHDSVMDRLGSADNLRNLWSIATAQDIASGSIWYHEAHEGAVNLSEKYNISVETAAQVIAVLSPKCDWNVNLEAASHVIAQYQSGLAFPEYQSSGVVALAAKWNNRIPFGCIEANVLKAFWILSGHPEALRGPKVEDFCRNILSCNESVTVDSHYVAAWLGLCYPGTWGFAEKYHKIVTEDTELVAREVGISPASFQAILWTVKKRIQSGTAEEAIKIMDAVRRAA